MSKKSKCATPQKLVCVRACYSVRFGTHVLRLQSVFVNFTPASSVFLASPKKIFPRKLKTSMEDDLTVQGISNEILEEVLTFLP